MLVVVTDLSCLLVNPDDLIWKSHDVDAVHIYIAIILHLKFLFTLF